LITIDDDDDDDAWGAVKLSELSIKPRHHHVGGTLRVSYNAVILNSLARVILSMGIFRLA